MERAGIIGSIEGYGCAVCGGPLAAHRQQSAGQSCYSCERALLALRCRLYETIRRVRALREAFRRPPAELREKRLRRELILMFVTALCEHRGQAVIARALLDAHLPTISRTMPDVELQALCSEGVVYLTGADLHLLDGTQARSELADWREGVDRAATTAPALGAT